MKQQGHHAKLLNDLAKNGVEPLDSKVREQYEQFKMDVTHQALKILRERIPVKILYFNELVNIKALPGDFLHCHDLESFQAPTLQAPVESSSTPNLSTSMACSSPSLSLIASLPPNAVVPLPPPRKLNDGVFERQAKRGRTTSSDTLGLSGVCTDGISASTTANTSEIVTSKQNAQHPGHLEATPTTYLHTSQVHSQIRRMEETIRKEALELIEMVGTVKLWIQLNIPRIEDGNNFGVAIQEEAIQELGRVEDAAFSLCDGIKYHMARAKLITKVIKYPNVEDYTRSVVEVDQKEWLHLKVSLIDMRNSYSMLYDLLHKNWEKVVKPRSADGNFMVM